MAAKSDGDVNPQRGESLKAVKGRQLGETGELFRAFFLVGRKTALLGEGGFAKVYRAVKRDDGTLWALKVIPRARVEEKDSMGRLDAEIQAMQAWEPPPNR